MNISNEVIKGKKCVRLYVKGCEIDPKLPINRSCKKLFKYMFYIIKNRLGKKSHRFNLVLKRLTIFLKHLRFINS